MAFTLNQFQAAIGNKGVQKAAEATTKFSATAWNTTKSTAVKTGSAVKGVMPATNKKVDELAAKYNSRLNNIEMNQRVADVKIQMLSQIAGVQFPTDEEIMEDLMEQDEAEAAAKKVQAVVGAVTNPEVMNVIGMLAQKFFGVNFSSMTDEELDKFGEEVDEILPEVEVKPEPKKKAKKEQPKKEEEAPKAEGKKGGRKKLGRQAPLAE